MTTAARSLTPNDLRLLDFALRANPAGDRLVETLTSKIADDDRFVATMNRGSLSAAERAAAIVAAYDVADEADLERCRAVIYRQRRELGCDSLPELIV